MRSTQFFICFFLFYPMVLLSSCDKSLEEDLLQAPKTYYINSENGSDNNDGQSKNSAWKSISKINDITLKPGDQILLANGKVYSEPIVIQNMNGTAALPILISSYMPSDETSQKKPFLDVKDALNGIKIIDCSHLQIENLEISVNPSSSSTSSSSKTMRCGVLIEPYKNGVSQDIELNNLTIKNVFYEKPGFVRPSNEVKSPNGTQNYGWGIRVINKNENATKDIKIKNTHVENVAHTGIKFTGKERNIQNVLVEKCTIIESGGPGLQMSNIKNGHILNNYVTHSGSNNDGRKWGRGSGLWTWGSADVLIEKNHFLNANGPADSAGAHIDFNCENIVMQYNVSANNAGGFIEILGNNYNCSYRYNLSVNDGHRVKGQNGAFQEGKVFWLSGFQGNGNARKGPFNSYIYNNTIVVKADILAKIAVDKAASGILVMNNIFYVEGESQLVLGDQYVPDSGGISTIENVVFENNLYLKNNNWPETVLIQDENPIFGDPKFSVGNGLKIENYQPTNIELIQNKGKQIIKIPSDNIGLTLGLTLSSDILGNPIKGLPDMGAIEIGN